MSINDYGRLSGRETYVVHILHHLGVECLSGDSSIRLLQASEIRFQGDGLLSRPSRVLDDPMEERFQVRRFAGPQYFALGRQEILRDSNCSCR